MTTETFTPEPLMSSSLEAQEMRRKKTEDMGSYFGDRIKRAEGKTALREAPKPPTKPLGLKPARTQINVAQLGTINEQFK